MLDSINTESKTDGQEKFDPAEHLASLCQGGKIEVYNFSRINYRKGWANIVEDLVKSIKCFPIEIEHISTDYGELDIRFKCYEKTQEVRVWRAIDIAKMDSRTICMECGRRAGRRILGDNVVVLCGMCVGIAEKNGETGTWLDRF